MMPSLPDSARYKGRVGRDVRTTGNRTPCRGFAIDGSLYLLQNDRSTATETDRNRSCRLGYKRHDPPPSPAQVRLEHTAKSTSQL